MPGSKRTAPRVAGEHFRQEGRKEERKKGRKEERKKGRKEERKKGRKEERRTEGRNKRRKRKNKRRKRKYACVCAPLFFGVVFVFGIVLGCCRGAKQVSTNLRRQKVIEPHESVSTPMKFDQRLLLCNAYPVPN